jgi:hypothetical protein
VDVNETDRIVNAVSVGWRVIAIAVPTRALRVIVEDLNIKFRVEQLYPPGSYHPARDIDWAWHVVSTHAGDDAWESLGPAMQDMTIKQARLKEKIKLAQHEKRMAMIKTENPYGLN